MEENFFTFLRQLGDEVLPNLFKNRACLQALFRSLTELEQVLILRLANVKQAVSERALRLWMCPNAIGELKTALGNLEANCIMQVAETKTKDGKNQYELNKDFKKGLCAALYGNGDVEDDSEAVFCFNVLETPAGFFKRESEDATSDKTTAADKNGTGDANRTYKTPSADELVKFSKEKLDFLLLFLVSKQVRKKTITASRLARRLGKQKMSKANAAKIKSMQDRLTKLTRYAGTISLDLLKVLERFDMVSDGKGTSVMEMATGTPGSPTSSAGSSNMGQGQVGMSRQALSWLLKDVYSQMTILLVGYLANLREGKSSVGYGTKWAQASSLERAQITSRYLTETIRLILILSQAKFGDCFNIKNLSRAQLRCVKFLSELGLVYFTCNKDPVYALDLSFLVPGQAQYYCGDSLYARSNVHDKKDGGRIIVQSNFKVYVYTASALQISVLSHICELQARTPNLVVGVLTRDSVQSAFKSGITGDQIIRFFASKNFSQNTGATKSAASLANTNPSLVSADAAVIPENVVRQIHMWEAERNRIELRAAVLFKRWDSEFMPLLFQRTVRWAQSKRFELYHTAWPLDPTCVEYQEWLKREKYLACPIESREEIVEKIRQLRAQIAHERANANKQQ